MHLKVAQWVLTIIASGTGGHYIGEALSPDARKTKYEDLLKNVRSNCQNESQNALQTGPRIFRLKNPESDHYYWLEFKDSTHTVYWIETDANSKPILGKGGWKAFSPDFIQTNSTHSCQVGKR